METQKSIGSQLFHAIPFEAGDSAVRAIHEKAQNNLQPRSDAERGHERKKRMPKGASISPRTFIFTRRSL